MSSFRFIILNAAISMLLLTGPATAATQHQIDRLTARAASHADPMSAATLKDSIRGAPGSGRMVQGSSRVTTTILLPGRTQAAKDLTQKAPGTRPIAASSA